MAALSLCCFAWAFFSCGKRGLYSSCGVWASHCNGFSGGAQALESAGFSICSSRALNCGLSSCGSWSYLLHGMWNLLRPEIKPVSPALAGDSYPPRHEGSPTRSDSKISLISVWKCLLNYVHSWDHKTCLHRIMNLMEIINIQ